jgi:hypothetical protein
MSNQAAGGSAVLDEDGRRCPWRLHTQVPAHPKGDERWSDGFHWGGGAFDASCTWSDARAATHDSLRAAKKPQLVYKHVGMRRNGKDQPPSRLSKKYAQPMPGHRSGLEPFEP